MPVQHNKQIGRVLRAAKLMIAMVLLIWGCTSVQQSLPTHLAQRSPTAADCTTYEAAFELHLDPEAAKLYC